MKGTDLHATAEKALDAQTRACQALIAAVISKAVVDASMPPIKEAAKVRSERSRFKANMPTGHARTAVYFLFAKDGGLEYYAQWLDIAVDTFRTQLLEHMYERKKYEAFNKQITEMQKKQFRFNYEWYLKKHGEGNETMYLCDDDYSRD